MWSLSPRRPNPARRPVRPLVEGCERRLLLSGTTAATAVISGTTYRDITGDGPSGDLTPEGGVTVQLFKAGGSSPVASTTSASNGTYSFPKLATGDYSVKEVVPSGRVETGGVGGYTVDLTKSGQAVTGRNFDNFDAALYSTSEVSGITYTVTSPAGQVTHPTALSGHVQQGDTVTVHFQLSKPEMVELVSYTAPNTDFNTANLEQQVVFSHEESSTTISGAQTMTVTVPNGDFQLDLVAGPVIGHFDPASNVEYHAQGRFIAGATGGTQADGLGSISGAVDVGTGKAATGLAGVTVVLTGYDYTGKQVKLTAVTDAKGDYTFAGLVASDPGGYRIAEVVPTGYVQAGGPTFLNLFLNTNTNRTGADFVDSPRKS